MLSFLVFFALSEPIFTDTTVFRPGDEGSKYYRIPAIVVAKDGTIVTATDKRWSHMGDLPANIDTVIKISKDKGVTWSETKTIAGLNTNVGYGDPSLVYHPQTGAILCLFTGVRGIGDSTYQDPERNLYCISYDNGETWSSMIDFTDQIYGINCTDPVRKFWKSNFLSSGHNLVLRSGRIMLVGVIKIADGTGFYNYVLYSDDVGKTWHVSAGYGTRSGDESKVVELANGTVLMYIRRNPYRYVSLSHDGGYTWSPQVARPDLVDPGCNGDIIRYTSIQDGYDKNRLITTNLYSTYDKGRKNLTIRISYDEGNTFPVTKVMQAEYCAYSSVAIDTNGDILVYYEGPVDSGSDGYNMRFIRTNLEWVTDGQDTYTPPKKVAKNDV